MLSEMQTEDRGTMSYQCPAVSIHDTWLHLSEQVEQNIGRAFAQFELLHQHLGCNRREGEFVECASSTQANRRTSHRVFGVTLSVSRSSTGTSLHGFAREGGSCTWSTSSSTCAFTAPHRSSSTCSTPTKRYSTRRSTLHRLCSDMSSFLIPSGSKQGAILYWAWASRIIKRFPTVPESACCTRSAGKNLDQRDSGEYRADKNIASPRHSCPGCCRMFWMTHAKSGAKVVSL